MGKRSQQLQCNACDHRWWVWFDNETRDELATMCAVGVGEHCPECDSQDWQLTDATRFAGGVIHTTSETCPECDYAEVEGVLLQRCPSGHEWVPHESDADPDDVELADGWDDKWGRRDGPA